MVSSGGKDKRMKAYLFGAKSIAIGVSRALRDLDKDFSQEGFLVSSLEGNPEEIDGIPVVELASAAEKLGSREKREIPVYLAVPEDIHQVVTGILENYGFANCVPVTAEREARWMERYYERLGLFPSVHHLTKGSTTPEVSVFAARFAKDRKLENPPQFPDYVHSILLGCSAHPSGEQQAEADFLDNTGEHISEKNPNYCEMTAFYWIWKNALEKAGDYVGVYHYRRALDLSKKDLQRMAEHGVDAVLPYPMIHLPDMREHHTRYIKETDWQAMLAALKELYPDYARAYPRLSRSIYFYNYNLILAKKKVFSDYCGWVFPLLSRVEELSVPRGRERGDRYTAYMSESLLTLYILYHRELKIYHTGRILYT